MHACEASVCVDVVVIVVFVIVVVVAAKGSRICQFFNCPESEYRKQSSVGRTCPLLLDSPFDSK